MKKKQKSLLQNNNVCKRCKPPTSENFLSTLKIRRVVNKYLLAEELDHCFTLEDNRDMLRHRFLIFHHQAHIYRKLNNGRNLDTQQLFDDFGEAILDQYPIDGKGKAIANYAGSNNNIFCSLEC